MGVLFFLLFMAVIIAVLTGFFFLVRERGKRSLAGNTSPDGPKLAGAASEGPVPGEGQAVRKENQVRYQGRTYAYNEDILTFLIMGIDKNSEAVEVAEGTDGGQADALFLAVLNPHTKEILILGINRNTMTDIDVYDDQGKFVKTVEGQIATQHGFGNGVEESCKYQAEAVARLMYGLPIHGYAAVNMSAIPDINDAVGGVDVTVPEDLTRADKTLVQGAQVHLEGESAFWYVKYRDTSVFGSADGRLERQRQYLSGFVRAAKEAAEKDLSVVLKLYQAVQPMMTTDITAEEAVYLATLALDYRFGTDSFRMLEGETVMGKEYEEFYADEDALYRLIIEVFYEEVH